MYFYAGKSLLMCSYAMVNYAIMKETGRGGGGLKIKFKKVLESII